MHANRDLWRVALVFDAVSTAVTTCQLRQLGHPELECTVLPESTMRSIVGGGPVHRCMCRGVFLVDPYCAQYRA
jgi:hypothetical protein